VVSCEKVKAHKELLAKISKGMATNKNGFGVEFESKNFKL
jgi:hypothetical protein